MFFLSCVCYVFVHVCLYVPCGHLLGWLSFVVSNCEFVTFPLVSWVRCGTWLIFAPLLTLLKDTTQWHQWGSNPQPLGLESSTLHARIEEFSSGGSRSVWQKKALTTSFFFFSPQLILQKSNGQFQRNLPFFNVPEGSNIFQGGGGPTFSRGVQLLIPYRNQYNLWLSRGGPDPLSPPLDPHLHWATGLPSHCKGIFFQRELSIIDFTLNYPPIRNNLTSASLLSRLIETDYLNYPPIRNNLTSASLLSMIIETDYNLLGMKARTVPRCRVRNIFFLSRSAKRCNSVFFSLCHLQIVLLTIANIKIHYFLPK